jgi:hypothetical protein
MLAYRKKTTWPYLIAVVVIAWQIVRIPSDWWYRFTKHNDPAHQVRIALAEIFSRDTRSVDHARTVHVRTSLAKPGARTASVHVSPEKGAVHDRLPVQSRRPVPFRLTKSPRPVSVPAQISSRQTDGTGDRATVVTEEAAPEAPPSRSGTIPDSPSPKDMVRAATSDNGMPAKIVDADGLKEQPARRTAWPRPISLLMQLDSLHGYPIDEQVARWIASCSQTIMSLESLPAMDDPNSEPLLDKMEELGAQQVTGNSSIADDRIAAEVRRVAYGVARRAAIWKAARLAVTESAVSSNPADITGLAERADRLRAWLAQDADTRPWIDYLLLDRLLDVSSSPLEADTELLHKAARQSLTRFESESLSESQKRFLAKPDFQPLRRQLRHWAVRPVELSDFLADVEDFELSRSDSSAVHLVEQIRDLRWSAEPQRVELGRQMELYYRNANLRVVIAESLLNALLPVVQPTGENVRDQILGASVRGRNNTWTQLGIKLIPDEQHIRIRLIAQGQTVSRTVSQKGPVRIFSRGNSNFNADKDIMISSAGISTFQAHANARGAARTLDIQTDFDQIPLLGWVVRQMAIDEQDENRHLLQAHVRHRVTSAAKSRLDETVEARLESAERRVADKLIEPLRELDLGLKAVEMKTTDQQIILRCRLAASHQLAAFTPRPRAVPGSLFEAQMHQSTINNLLQQAGLSGQRIELEQLMDRLRDRLGLTLKDIDEDIPEDVTLQLAKGQPIRVNFDDDRVQVSVRITQLSTPDRTWRNFEVRARYRADASGTHVDLQRDGGIELSSEAIGFRDQVALRGIFTKVMTRNHRWQVLRGRFEKDPRLTRLRIVQFVCRDGWIGISLAAGERDRIARDAVNQRR